MAASQYKKPQVFFKRTDGLNTKEDPARLTITDKGTAELAVALNVEATQSGRVSCRKGYQRRISGAAFHSLFPVGNYALCVKDSELVTIGESFASTMSAGPVALRTVSPRRRMAYVRVADTVYYANGMQNGRVVDRVNYPWSVGEYVGPETTRTFSDPPVGHKLCLHNGRIYIAQMIMDSTGAAHHVIWYTEPFAYNAVDLSRNFIPLEHRVVMLKSLPGSLVVGTTGGVYTLMGSTPEEFIIRKLTDSPVVEGTAAKTRSEIIGEMDSGSEVILLTCHEGVCLVADDGYFTNLTHRKIDMPHFREGCAAMVNNRYLTCMYK